ncbi:MAG TPA: hypothetical protein PKH52_02360, partial [bacterium]|nr:hypothetical protein [bacterium]
VEEIDNLISNIKGLLKEGGNCRITPISTQNEKAKQAILYNLKQIVDSKEYNIHADKDYSLNYSLILATLVRTSSTTPSQRRLSEVKASFFFF